MAGNLFVGRFKRICLKIRHRYMNNVFTFMAINTISLRIDVIANPVTLGNIRPHASSNVI